MSNKIKQMAKTMPAPKVSTKEVTYEIDVFIDGYGEKCAIMVVTGVPADLPAEYEDTILRTAEMQFAQALNSRSYLEFYDVGKSAKDEQPLFINLRKTASIKILDVKKIEERKVDNK